MEQIKKPFSASTRAIYRKKNIWGSIYQDHAELFHQHERNFSKKAINKALKNVHQSGGNKILINDKMRQATPTGDVNECQISLPHACIPT